MTHPPRAEFVEAMARGWQPFSTLDAMPWDQRPGRIFARFTGWKEHSGVTWAREHADLVWTRKDQPFHIAPDDRKRVMQQGDMDGIDGIAAWMPATMQLRDIVSTAAIPGLPALLAGTARVVTVEATEAMLEAADFQVVGCCNMDADDARECYDAMLAASPFPAPDAAP